MGVKFPFGTGKIVEDLSPETKDVKDKELYIINLDDTSPRDMRGRIKIYGAFWCAKGNPAPVNKVAVSLWSKFGVGTKIIPKAHDYDHLSNIDGRHTKDGERYAGFMSIPLAINVYKVDSDGWLARLYNMKLLERCLEVVGITVGGSSIPIKVGNDFLKGKVFALTGVFMEVSENKSKSTDLVTKMLEAAGAKVNVRMTKKTDFLLAGKNADLYLVKKAETKFPNIKVVNLNTIHKVLLGEITLEDVEKQPSLTKEDCKDGRAYEVATTIPANLLDSSSDLEKAINELTVFPSWQRDKAVLQPLFDIFGYPKGYDKKNPPSTNDEEDTSSNKRQKTG